MHIFITPRLSSSTLTATEIQSVIQGACEVLPGTFTTDNLTDSVLSSLYKGAINHEIYQSMTLAARPHIEREPAYAFVAARLLLNVLYSEALGKRVTFRDADSVPPLIDRQQE